MAQINDLTGQVQMGDLRSPYVQTDLMGREVLIDPSVQEDLGMKVEAKKMLLQPHFMEVTGALLQAVPDTEPIKGTIKEADYLINEIKANTLYGIKADDAAPVMQPLAPSTMMKSVQLYQELEKTLSMNSNFMKLHTVLVRLRTLFTQTGVYDQLIQAGLLTQDDQQIFMEMFGGQNTPADILTLIAMTAMNLNSWLLRGFAMESNYAAKPEQIAMELMDALYQSQDKAETEKRQLSVLANYGIIQLPKAEQYMRNQHQYTLADRIKALAIKPANLWSPDDWNLLPQVQQYQMTGQLPMEQQGFGAGAATMIQAQQNLGMTWDNYPQYNPNNITPDFTTAHPANPRSHMTGDMFIPGMGHYQMVKGEPYPDSYCQLVMARKAGKEEEYIANFNKMRAQITGPANNNSNMVGNVLIDAGMGPAPQQNNNQNLGGNNMFMNNGMNGNGFNNGMMGGYPQGNMMNNGFNNGMMNTGYPQGNMVNTGYPQAGFNNGYNNGMMNQGFNNGGYPQGNMMNNGMNQGYNNGFNNGMNNGMMNGGYSQPVVNTGYPQLGYNQGNQMMSNAYNNQAVNNNYGGPNNNIMNAGQPTNNAYGGNLINYNQQPAMGNFSNANNKVGPLSDMDKSVSDNAILRYQVSEYGQMDPVTNSRIFKLTDPVTGALELVSEAYYMQRKAQLTNPYGAANQPMVNNAPQGYNTGLNNVPAFTTIPDNNMNQQQAMNQGYPQGNMVNTGYPQPGFNNGMMNNSFNNNMNNGFAAPNNMMGGNPNMGFMNNNMGQSPMMNLSGIVPGIF